MDNTYECISIILSLQKFGFRLKRHTDGCSNFPPDIECVIV